MIPSDTRVTHRVGCLVVMTSTFVSIDRLERTSPSNKLCTHCHQHAGKRTTPTVTVSGGNAMDDLGTMDGYDGVDDADDRLYDYLLDVGVLNDVHTVAESIVSSSTLTSDDAADGARRTAERLLDRNSDFVDRALDAVVRDAGRILGGQGQWRRRSGGATGRPSSRLPVSAGGGPTSNLDIGPGRPVRDTLRHLDALARLPLARDAYAGPRFRRLTKGLEWTLSAADVFFGPTLRVYAGLVDGAPDAEAAAESFGSLCEAAHHRLVRRDPAKCAATARLLIGCLSGVCRRSGSGSRKHVRPAIVEFLAVVVATAGGGDPVASTDHSDGGLYAALCCVDPTATWFDAVARRLSSRSVFFECLHGDRGLLKCAVASFVRWMAEPVIPDASAKGTGSVVRYACALHAIYLLAKMYAFRAARTMFPVKVPRSGRVHAVGVANHCLGFMSANRDATPPTLARGLCKLVATIAEHHVEVVRSLVGHMSAAYGVRILADVAERRADLVGSVATVDELFEKCRRKDGGRIVVGSLTRLAAALCYHRYEHVWRLITRRMPFLEAVAAVGHRPGDEARMSMMAEIRCTPLGPFTYDLKDGTESDEFDWRDACQMLSVSVACAHGDQGRDWLERTEAFGSLDRFVAARLDEAERSLMDPEDQKTFVSIVNVAYSYCASAEGLRILLEDHDVVGRAKLTELYYLRHEDFEGHPIGRDVIAMLWLRLIEAATHTFSSRIYTDLKLKYRDTISKLSTENCMEDGTVFVDEKSDLLKKLQRFPWLTDSQVFDAPVVECSSKEILTNMEDNGDDCVGDSSWLRRVRTDLIHSDRMSGDDTVDLIISYGRRLFNDRLDLDPFDGIDKSADLTDFEATGIQLAMRYGSSVGIVSTEDSAASGLRRLYSRFINRRPGSEVFDCATCTLYIMCQGSENKCVEACAVLLKLEGTTRFFWPRAFDRVGEVAIDERAAFGHLVEGMLQQELPEVHNAFKMSGVSWWLLCSGWATDCFWGRLSWPEICRWLCLIVLSPLDYQAFFFTCIASAQKRRWLEAFNQGQFHDTIYQKDFYDFRLVDHADYLENLAKKYQRSITKRLASEFDTN